EEFHERVALDRKERLECSVLLLGSACEDERLHVRATLTPELVLGAAQPDPLGPALAGAGGVLPGIGVCSYRHPPCGISVGEEPVHGGDEFGDVFVCSDLQRGVETLSDVDRGGGVDDVHLPGEYLAGGAIDRDDCPFG